MRLSCKSLLECRLSRSDGRSTPPPAVDKAKADSFGDFLPKPTAPVSMAKRGFCKIELISDAFGVGLGRASGETSV